MRSPGCSTTVPISWASSASSSCAATAASGRVSSYPYGLDENTDNGESYANLFAPGAVFTRPRTEGHDNLAALANGQPHGAHYTRHFITNHVIEPAPGGAIGKEYAVIIEGALSTQIGFDRYVLEVGDSLTFDSTIPHRFWNAGDVPARAIWVILNRAR